MGLVDLASYRAGCAVVSALRGRDSVVPGWSRRLRGRVGYVLAVELVPRSGDPVASQSWGWTGAAAGSPDPDGGRGVGSRTARWQAGYANLPVPPNRISRSRRRAPSRLLASASM